MNIEFPIKYFEGNLVFSQDGSCWAYYQLARYNYDFLADDEKEIIFTKISVFLANQFRYTFAGGSKLSIH